MQAGEATTEGAVVDTKEEEEEVSMNFLLNLEISVK